MLPLFETLWKTQKLCEMPVNVWISVLLATQKSESLSLVWLTQTYSANKCHVLQTCPGNKPFLKSKVIYPALPQHWALPACRGAASHEQWDAAQEIKVVWSALAHSKEQRCFDMWALYPFEGLVLSRSADRYLESRLHIDLWTLGWVFPWIPSDSQIAWELYRQEQSQRIRGSDYRLLC